MTQILNLAARFLGDEPKFIPADNWAGVQRQLDWCLGFFAAYFAAVDPEEYYGDARPKRTELLQKVQAFERALMAIKCCTLCGGSGFRLNTKPDALHILVFALATLLRRLYLKANLPAPT